MGIEAQRCKQLGGGVDNGGGGRGAGEGVNSPARRSSGSSSTAGKSYVDAILEEVKEKGSGRTGDGEEGDDGWEGWD